METSVKSSLIKYIQIPNQTRKSYNEQDWLKVGTTNEDKGGYQLIEEAATHIANWVKDLNLTGAHVTLKKREDKTITPLILIVIDGDKSFNQQDTLFFYGHLDKQPPMNDKGQWTHGTPTNPEIVLDPLDPKKTKLIYGRGGADDGYSTYATMTAIKGLQQQGIKLPSKFCPI